MAFIVKAMNIYPSVLGEIQFLQTCENSVYGRPHHKHHRSQTESSQSEWENLLGQTKTLNFSEIERNFASVISDSDTVDPMQ